MNFFSDFLNSGTPKQQKNKKLGALIICITAVLLAVALITLTVGSIVMTVKNKNKGDDESNDTGVKIPNGFTTTTLDASLSVNGDLLLIDADHPYTGTPTTVLFNGHETRPLTGNGGKVYSIGGTDRLSATEATVIAFNKMIADFYADPTAGGDDCLYISGAYDITAVNQAPAYQSGTSIALRYYENYELYKNDPNHILSIYGVEKYEWIYDHAHEYGFIQASAVEGDENIFRYIGPAHATYIKNQNKTLAEYITILQGRTYRSPLSIAAKNAEGESVSYGVYYLSAEAIATEGAVIPAKYTYTVSGDNMGGYIVTYDKSTTKN